MGHRIAAWGPALGWAGVIFALSAIPDSPVAVEIPFVDKVAHFGLYGVLGVALAYGQGREARPIGTGWLILAGAVYAASDEWHQAFVPGRTPEVADWLADVIGLIVGFVWAARRFGRADGRSSTPPGTGA